MAPRPGMVSRPGAPPMMSGQHPPRPGVGPRPPNQFPHNYQGQFRPQQPNAMPPQLNGNPNSQPQMQVPPAVPIQQVQTTAAESAGPVPKRRLYPNQPGDPYAESTHNNMQQSQYPPGPAQTFTPATSVQGQNQYQPSLQDPNSLVNPMGNMTMNPAAQYQNQLQTIPLLHFEPKMSDLTEAAPAIQVSPSAAVNPASPYLECDPELFRCTLHAVPDTPALLRKSKLPLGLVMTPYKPLEPTQHVPNIQDTITRCRYCRAYINPYVSLIQTKWKCNLCPGINDLPQNFDYDMISRQAVDRFQRPELNCSVVDYSAPVEYTVRAPHPPIYMFVIDVSYASVQNGMVATVAKAILDSLDRIPNPDQRTKVAFMTVDSNLHFYKLSAGGGDPEMMVVGDLDEVVIPHPEDLVVNLVEFRACIESFLGRLGLMFKSNQNVGNALGPALNAAQKMLLNAGGKIVVFQTILPTLHSGDMSMREDPKLLGTPKESSLLNPSTSFFKNFALDCVRSYICIDMFLFGSQYMDVATLASATKFSGGHLYHYPGFHANRTEDVTKVRHEVAEFLAHDIGLEAVLRLRCSTGLRANAFYGNFFLRSTQLLALSNVTPNHCYTVELAIDEDLKANEVAFQSALLYTAINGERRIRVMTMVLPTTKSITDVYRSADQVALATFLTKKAVDRALNSKLEDARDALIYKCAEILSTVKTEFSSSATGATSQLPVPANLRHYPFLTLAAIKNIGLRGGSTTPSDLRFFAINHINLSPPELLIPFLAPKMYALHCLDPEVGTYDESHRAILPAPLNLRSDALDQGGIYLLDTVHRAMIYVGTRADPKLLTDLFAVSSYGALFGGKVTLPLLDSTLSRQVQVILAQNRKEAREVYYQEIHVIKEDGDPSLRLMFLTHMVEDRTNSVQSYHQFINHLKELVNTGKA
ncbi:COPII subunit [Entomophthora muscae]|uniref:COPII subunit n=1 Tax=Entomophthora muscae TaxID=34485 RepID=A0ACC2ULZ1_9FUNG|nr:COPII subunit [Entomophthora muscae]